MSLTAPAVTNARPTSSADRVAWNLSDLYAGVDDPQLGRDLEAALSAAEAFETAYRGKIDVPGGPAADLLLAAVRELEGLSEQMDDPSSTPVSCMPPRPTIRATGHCSPDARTRTAINKHLIFFDLEWVKVADDPARRLLAAP